MGLGDATKQYRDRYCKAIGIEPLPDNGSYFVRWDKYVKGSNLGGRPGEEVWKQFTEAPEAALEERASFPRLPVGWRRTSGRSIWWSRRSERPRWYSPLIADRIPS